MEFLLALKLFRDLRLAPHIFTQELAPENTPSTPGQLEWEPTSERPRPELLLLGYQGHENGHRNFLERRHVFEAFAAADETQHRKKEAMIMIALIFPRNGES